MCSSDLQNIPTAISDRDGSGGIEMGQDATTRRLRRGRGQERISCDVGVAAATTALATDRLETGVDKLVDTLRPFTQLKGHIREAIRFFETEVTPISLY